MKSHNLSLKKRFGIIVLIDYALCLTDLDVWRQAGDNPMLQGGAHLQEAPSIRESQRQGHLPQKLPQGGQCMDGQVQGETNSMSRTVR